MRIRLMLAVGVVLGLAAVVRAAPVDLQQIAADAKWAAHLDVAALMASDIPQKAKQRLLEKHPEAEKHLQMVCAVWNFDPRTDLQGITIYGTQMKRKTGVAVVHAKVDQNLLLDKVQQAPNHQATTYGKYELHTWDHGVGSRHERAMTGVFYKPDVMVFGASPDEVKAALDVLDGTKPNFTSKESGLSLSIPSGAILVAGAVGLSEVDLPCESPLARKAHALVLAIGVDQGDVFLVGQVVAKEAEVAQQVKTVLDGGLALAAISKSDDPEALKLIQAVNVTAYDKMVNVEWRAPVDDVWAGVHKAIAEAKKARKHWKEHKKSDRCPLEK